MIKVTDLAYARFRAPDLDVMETFLTDFGLVRSARTDTALYMRARGAEHHVHVTELGQSAFIGPAFYAASEEDLEIISQVPGASTVQDIEEPGGGKRVRLTDPDGFTVEVVHGIEQLAELPAQNVFKPNYGDDVQRKGELLRLSSGPAQCLRLGHVVINVTNFEKSNGFYQSLFGFLSSDEMYNKDGETTSAFSRLDKGDEFVDHHTFVTIPSAEPQFGHLAFEVEDVNAVYLGHEYLQSKGYQHSWGIGRHLYGSQVFDYWFDPYGFRVEHWTDGDLLNADAPIGRYPEETGLDVQWGTNQTQRVTEFRG